MGLPRNHQDMLGGIHPLGKGTAMVAAPLKPTATLPGSRVPVDWVKSMPIAIKADGTGGGKYLVTDVLGLGGMGAVVRVERTTDRQVFALKYCTDNDPNWLRRFAREVRLMQAISHEHVVTIVDADLNHTPPYFLMPLAIGSLE